MDKEKLKYLMLNMPAYINGLIEEVLTDSLTDPHYSAVFASNTIKCYIRVMQDIGEELPFQDVKGYFEFNVYTEEEYNQFEKLREKESAYYRGIQY